MLRDCCKVFTVTIHSMEFTFFLVKEPRKKKCARLQLKLHYIIFLIASYTNFLIIVVLAINLFICCCYAFRPIFLLTSLSISKAHYFFLFYFIFQGVCSPHYFKVLNNYSVLLAIITQVMG